VAAKTVKTPEADKETVSRVVAELKRAERTGRDRVAQYRSRYRSWVGVLERENDIWESQLAPKYAFQKIDTLLANLNDAAPKGLVRACRPGAEEAAAAKAMQKAINEFRRRDGWAKTRYENVQQTVVMGLSPVKTDYRYERGLERWRELEAAPLDPLTGAVALDPNTGQPIVPRLVEKSGFVSRWNQPRATVIPVEDFLWDPSATRAADCAWMAARYWVTAKHLKDMEKLGVYKNVAEACETRSGRKSSDTGIGMIPVDRTGRIFIWEYWERDRIITIANNTVLLRDDINPYWHGELPFSISTTLPDLYRVEGFSEIELIAELQAALWEFLNQRIDNTRFITNAAIVMQEGTTISENSFYPGAVITTDGDPTRSVMPWTPNISIVGPALEAERDLKADMDDITGVTPYVSGAGSQTLDQQTATQISTFASMAGRRLEQKRNLLFSTDVDKGLQEIALIQQFVNEPIPIRGAENADGSHEWTTVLPQEIVNALLEYEIEESSESIDRQIRRQESMMLANLGMQLQGPIAQEGKMLLVSKLFSDTLDSFDRDAESYFQPLPPPPAPAAPAAPAPGPGGQAGVVVPESDLAALLAGGSGPPPPPSNGNGSAAAPPPPPGVPVGA
jgi:hypothetical protein